MTTMSFGRSNEHYERRAFVNLESGQRITNVHAPVSCEGRSCPIDNPSHHFMFLWPMQWNDMSDRFERECECGAWHPDPDQFSYWMESHLMDRLMHRCCENRCCCLIYVPPARRGPQPSANPPGGDGTRVG